jgi:hypothetical protein
MGVEIKLYNLYCSEEILIKRVFACTSAMPSDAFFINENAIQEFRLYYEPIN